MRNKPDFILRNVGTGDSSSVMASLADSYLRDFPNKGIGIHQSLVGYLVSGVSYGVYRTKSAIVVRRSNA